MLYKQSRCKISVWRRSVGKTNNNFPYWRRSVGMNNPAGAGHPLPYWRKSVGRVSELTNNRSMDSQSDWRRSVGKSNNNLPTLTGAIL